MKVKKSENVGPKKLLNIDKIWYVGNPVVKESDKLELR